MNNELWFVLGSNLITGIMTIAAIKTDIVWIKEKLKEHSKRIYSLERNT